MVIKLILFDLMHRHMLDFARSKREHTQGVEPDKVPEPSDRGFAGSRPEQRWRAALTKLSGDQHWIYRLCGSLCNDKVILVLDTTDLVVLSMESWLLL